MRRLLLILVFVFLVGNITASCNETQININSASAEELDNLTGIGQAYASRIIEKRMFNSVDDLINVDGIGPATLEKIKQQGLACVDEEIENEDNSEQEEEEKNNSVEKEVEEENLIYENVSQKLDNEMALEPISLNSKNIKSGEDNENLGKNLALGGIVTFCVMFGALFLLKTRKKKNEFR
ncbi:MAG: helix-hairpin-helix domain-containing protein [Candidatus Nanoarchaeia archaeon]|nr:helix-hairpin-helix domain-containing protein [Candidatus Nanoarchaeia archaeon]MDD5357587.1 helix-hairpin-helix domain-containing protein [Candidatus Nanoarchaeia archaeon]MDD5588506.1 helix-hairpin-helix domain-containing protein [Candidatus Nanoarchaeia archaeon]